MKIAYVNMNGEQVVKQFSGLFEAVEYIIHSEISGSKIQLSEDEWKDGDELIRGMRELFS